MDIIIFLFLFLILQQLGIAWVVFGKGRNQIISNVLLCFHFLTFFGKSYLRVSYRSFFDPLKAFFLFALHLFLELLSHYLSNCLPLIHVLITELNFLSYLLIGQCRIFSLKFHLVLIRNEYIYVTVWMTILLHILIEVLS